MRGLGRVSMLRPTLAVVLMTMIDQDDAPSRISRRERFHYLVRRFQRHPIYLFAKDSFRFVRQLLPNIWRLATYRQRSLPGIMIIGAQKSGTTQLYANLLRHPKCFGATRKELHYFSKHPRWPRSWYRSRFPLKSQVDRFGGICIEASPSYLPSAPALRRMHALLPDALIIAVLRDPVARAFSHYQHDKSRRRESRGFPEAVVELIEQNQTISPEFGWAQRPGASPLMNYVARGYYALQLESLLQIYPREQVVVLDSAELFSDTNIACQHIFNLLSIEPIEIQSEKVYNRGYYREKIDPSTAQRLREHYRPHDELLCELLGRSFSWMTTAAIPTCATIISDDRSAA